MHAYDIKSFVLLLKR